MADEDPEYTAAVRRLPCKGPKCERRLAAQAHHRTGAGMAQRAHDHLSMPLCVFCHHNFHAAAGEFKGWGKLRRDCWQDEKIRDTWSVLLSCNGKEWAEERLRIAALSSDPRLAKLTSDIIIADYDEVF